MEIPDKELKWIYTNLLARTDTEWTCKQITDYLEDKLTKKGLINYETD